MSDPITRTLARQVLAGIIAAPRNQATATINRLEPADFSHWVDRTIFEALQHVEFPEHDEPGSIITQLNRILLDSGAYTGTDNGLRAAMIDLAQTRGDVNQLHLIVDDLIETRLREETMKAAARVQQHASNSPLHDLDAALEAWAGTDLHELARLLTRLPEGRRISANA